MPGKPRIVGQSTLLTAYVATLRASY